MPPREVKLSKTQAEILAHRLEVPNCIAEALCDEVDDDATRDRMAEAIEFRAAKLLAHIKESPSVPIVDLLDRWILWDAVDGSTYLACTQSEFGRDGQKTRTVKQALTRLTALFPRPEVEWIP